MEPFGNWPAGRLRSDGRQIPPDQRTPQATTIPFAPSPLASSCRASCNTLAHVTNNQFVDNIQYVCNVTRRASGDVVE